MKTCRAPRRDSARGFTLIELMIVVAIAAILGAVALPSFLEQVRKSRRADAITSLNKIAQAQERWRANNATYGTLTNVSVANPTSGYYTLAVSGTSGTGYTAVATAAGSQANDAKCTSLTLTMSNGELTYTSAGSATAAQCWSR